MGPNEEGLHREPTELWLRIHIVKLDGLHVQILRWCYLLALPSWMPVLACVK